ncbi:MAG: hypothetical protein D3909_08245 [Candidatus Electrothrix sp. ATG1]|nr:hypothetical protein [Candidatus Electrothrix sp. ATG1]
MKKNNRHNQKTPEDLGVTAGAAQRRSYSPPRVLSAELLEAAAATCDPGGSPPPQYGKNGCLELGS